MIPRKMPPLNALRAFEATARHLSVKSAAEELCVTPGAVSQMLKALELHLGVQLFQRVNRGILLSEVGRDYLPAVSNALQQIAAASERIATVAETRTLTVSTTPFFAFAWLVPRLKEFQEAHPEIDVHVETGGALADFAREGIDVAIRHGLGQYPGLHSELIIAAEVVPVASPALAARHPAPTTPADLKFWPHVHDAERKAWHRWFREHGIEDMGLPRGPSFDDAGLLLKAVLSGQGAGLLPAALVALEIEQRRLVELAGAVRLDDFAYYLVYPHTSTGRPKVAAFHQWIRTAAANGRQATEAAPSTIPSD